MRRIIGNEVIVVLKDSENGNMGDMSGILIDVSDEELYVRDSGDSRIFVIPRENVQYCTTDCIPPARQFVKQCDKEKQQGSMLHEAVPQNQTEYRPVDQNHILVYVDEDLVADIQVNNSLDLNRWSDTIFGIVMGDEGVQQAVAGKIQKEFEYSPGEVYITTREVVPPSQMPQANPRPSNNENSFSMSGSGSPESQYLNPTQMISRLNKVAKRGKGDDEKEM